LVTTPFLFEVKATEIRAADQELALRGWPIWVVGVLRFLLKFSLWTNQISWDENVLGWFDIVSGYALFLVFPALVCLVLAVMFGVFFLKLAFFLLIPLMCLIVSMCAFVAYRKYIKGDYH